MLKGANGQSSPVAVYLMGAAVQTAGSSRIFLLAVYAQSLGASRWSIGLLFTFWVAGAAASAIPVGVLADRWGRRRVLVAAAAIACVTQFAAAFTTSIPVLLGLQLMAGLAGGSLQASLLAALGDAVPGPRLGRAMGWYTLANQLANLAGPALAGVLLAVLPVRDVIEIFGSLFLIAGVVMWFGVTAPAQGVRIGAWSEIATLSRRPGFYPVLVALLAIFMLFGSYTAYLPVFGLEGLRVRPDEVGYLLAMQAAVNAPSRIPIGWLVDRFNRPGPMIIGSLLMVAGAIAILPHLHGFWPAAILLMAFAPATGLLIISSSVAFYSVAAGLPKGSAMGFYVSVQMVAFGLGPTLVGPLMESSYLAGFTASALIPTVLLFAVVALRGLDFGVRPARPAAPPVFPVAEDAAAPAAGGDMSRLFPRPDRADLDAADQAAYDHVVGGMAELMAHPQWEGAAGRVPRGEPRETRVGGYYGALLTSPPLAKQLLDMSAFYRACEARGAFPAPFREFINVVLAGELGYRTGLVGHVPYAIAVGVRREAIRAVIDGAEGGLTADERMQVEYVRAVVRGRLDDAAHARMGERLGRRGALEYTAFICYLMHHIRLMQAVGVPEPSAEELAAILEPHLAAGPAA